MLTIAEQLIRLTKSLLPTGRAFRAPYLGVLDRVYRALNDEQEVAYNDSRGILDSILPDNANFTADDASDWERRLGIAASSATSLVDRRAAIQRKYAHPGNILARQGPDYIEGQLQAAGFNVFVHENLTGESPGTYITTDVFTHGSISAFHGSGLTSGGGLATFLVVNSIDPAIDAAFDLGSDFRNLFFIGGQTLGDTADVPSVRETEFRQLILSLKPTHLAAALIINYT